MAELKTHDAVSTYDREDEKLLLRRTGPLGQGEHRTTICPRSGCRGRVDVRAVSQLLGTEARQDLIEYRCNACGARGTIWPWAGIDGEWLRHGSWQQIIAELRDPIAAGRWLDRLREEFPPGWSLQEMDHPIQFDCALRTHRVPLLEMAQVLVTVRCHGLRARLRDPKGYVGARHELRGGAVLLEMGADLKHEPMRPRTGPDWHATWPDGFAYVEVKAPRTSVRANHREVRAGQFTSSFLGAIGGIGNGPGLWATLRPTESFLDGMGALLTDASSANTRAKEVAAVFSSMLKLRSALGPLRGRFVLVPGCDVVLRARRDGMTGIAVDGYFTIADSDDVTLRLKDDLEEASRQLKDVPGHRVILLDTAQDAGLRRPSAVVRTLVTTEPWAARVACVVIVYRDYPHTKVELVLGRTDDAMETYRLLASKLRRCEHGHLHAEALVTPEPCSET